MDPFYFILPQSQMKDFFDNPFDYLLRSNGMKSNSFNLSDRIVNSNEMNDDHDDSSILTMMNHDNDEVISTSRINIDEYRNQRTESLIAEEEALQIADVNQLGIKREREKILINIFLFSRIFNTIFT